MVHSMMEKVFRNFSITGGSLRHMATSRNVYTNMVANHARTQKIPADKEILSFIIIPPCYFE